MVAAPLPAAYTGSSGGEIVGLSVDALSGPDLARVDLVHSRVAVDSQLAGASSATSANLGVNVGPLGVADSVTVVAPPDASSSGSLLEINSAGIDTGALTYADAATWAGLSACVATGTAIAHAQTQTAGITAAPLGLMEIVQTGVATTDTTNSLVSVSSTHDTRAVESSSTGTLAGLGLVAKAITVSITGAPTLTALATGTATGSAVTYTPATAVTATVGGVTTPLVLGATVTLSVPGVASVDLHLTSDAEVVRAVAADGSSAVGSTVFLTATVSVLAAVGPPLAVAQVDILSLRASATAPSGGVECDTTPPTITITSPVDGSVINDATPSISGTSDLFNGTVLVSIDGGAAVPVPTDGAGGWGPLVSGTLADGPHVVTVTAIDAAGNTGTATSVFTVDATAPVVAITSPVDGSVINDATPAISGTSDVLNGAVFVQIDGGVFMPVFTDGTGAWGPLVSGTLADGPHVVTVLVADTAGNLGTATSSFTVDTTPPAITITTPVNGSSINDTTPTIAGTSDVLNGTVQVSVDGGPSVSVPTDVTGSWTTTLVTPLSEAAHTVAVSATDAAGNLGSATSSFTVDTTGPVIVITSPVDGSVINDATPSISGTSDVLNGTVLVSIDGGAAVPVPTDGAGGWGPLVSGTLADGPHVVTVTAIDAAGNTGTATSAFTVDTTAPVVAITSPVDGSVINDATPAISGTSDILSGSVQLVLDGGAPVTVPTGVSGAWSHPVGAALVEGAHTVTVTAVDLAGNTATASAGFTVDTTPPVIAITTPVNGSSINDTTPTIAGTSDILSGSVQLVLDGGAPVAVPTGVSGAWSHPVGAALVEGAHMVTVTAVDLAGNTATAISAFGVDVTAPLVAIVMPVNGSVLSDTTPTIVGTSNLFNATVLVSIASGVASSSVGAQPVPTDGAGAWSTTLAALADGLYTVTASATDAAGNTAIATTTFAIDTTGPALAIVTPADGSATSDPTPTFMGTSSVLDGIVRVSIDGGLSVSVPTGPSGNWTFVPGAALADGRHTFTVTASDPLGNTTTVTISFVIATLPVTGFTPAPLLLVGVMLVVAGSTLRRRRRA